MATVTDELSARLRTCPLPLHLRDYRVERPRIAPGLSLTRCGARRFVVALALQVGVNYIMIQQTPGTDDNHGVGAS